MDPLTHAVLGIAGALAATRKTENRRAGALAGFVAGTLPDADVLLRSPHDPLFALEYHRHFTHSVAFSPVIMLIGAGTAWLILRGFRQRVAFTSLLLPALVAAWAHIVCDLWTSYGTRVFWPFRQDRLALDWISVIDPLMTLPLAALSLLAVLRKSRRAAIAGLGWVGFYLALCVVQQHRASVALGNWIAFRGHTAERVSVKSSFGNIIVWRGLYLAEGNYYASAIRPGRPGDVRLIPGESVPFLAGPATDDHDWQGFPARSTAVRDVRRFYHFSGDWVAWNPQAGGEVLGDLRYASMPAEFNPLWGIDLDRDNPQNHVQWVTFRRLNRTSFAPLWALIRGQGF
ncbi:MAG: metal-dependent hydrolase [Verrucomicrobiales bacterium]